MFGLRADREIKMKFIKCTFAIVVFYLAFFIDANASPSKSELKINSKLDFVEEKVSSTNKGRKEVLDGLSNLDPVLRKISCNSFVSAQPDKSTKKIVKEYKWLKKNKNKMSDAQVERFVEITSGFNEFNSSIDCENVFNMK